MDADTKSGSPRGRSRLPRLQSSAGMDRDLAGRVVAVVTATSRRLSHEHVAMLLASFFQRAGASNKCPRAMAHARLRAYALLSFLSLRPRASCLSVRGQPEACQASSRGPWP